MSKRMQNILNAKKGDLVVVADFVGTQVYTINELKTIPNGTTRIVLLDYPTKGHGMVSGGAMPLSSCYVPTPEQLAFYKAEQAA